MYREKAQEAVREKGNHTTIILDVRTQSEWDEGHAKEAHHWDVMTESNTPPDFPKDSHIYTYCRSGARSGQAANVLKNFGFTNVTNIGGLSDWIEAGGEISV